LATKDIFETKNPKKLKKSISVAGFCITSVFTNSTLHTLDAVKFGATFYEL